MRQRLMMVRIVAPGARPYQRPQQPVDAVGILLQPGGAEGQHLLNPAPPDALANGDPLRQARIHRRAAPGFARDEAVDLPGADRLHRSEEHTSELQSLMRISYAVFCLKKKKKH